MKNTLKTPLLFIVVASLGLFIYCHSGKTTLDAAAESPYLNVRDDVAYVGSETCQSCHQEIYKTFKKTGMGQSFDHATLQKSAANFEGHIAIYDSISDFYYQPFWRKDSLYIKEFRVEKGDTTHQRLQHVKYIVGSGQHTNSHLWEENGYLFQAPITFYTQKGIWDLAPGFEGGFNARFQRMIGLECMACHNSYPEFVQGSENKYRKVQNGIGCERCHGAGGEHVKRKLAGEVIDTSLGPDFSIVNPSRLSRELELNVCQRCHLQGVAILKEGKDFEDFKPSLPLTDVMDVYLPEFDGAETQFIMASQAHRLTKSLCFQKSTMTCLTCHNPHISVKHTPRQTFNDACIQCHLPTEAAHITCPIPEQERLTTNQNDCSACHTPPLPSIDIPHVTVHDHYIRKPISDADRQKVQNFIGLANVVNDKDNPLTRAKAYLHYYESYTSNRDYLDSASFYLAKSEEGDLLKRLEVSVHLNYLRQDFLPIIKAADRVNISRIKDAWTAYRIGEAYLQQADWKNANAYFDRANTILPLQADFLTKLGTTFIQLGDFTTAKAIFETVLEENPSHLSARTNLGFVIVNLGQLQQAQQHYEQVLSFNPDYEQALLNLGALHLLNRDKKSAQKLARRLLKINPNSEEARRLMEEVGRSL